MNNDLLKFGTAIDRGRHDVVFFAEKFLGMDLHNGQKKFLRAKAKDVEAGRQIKVWLLVPANRWGKSILVAILHIWHNFYKIGIGQGNGEAWARASYMTANLAPHSDATKPVFDAIKAILTSSFAIPQEDGGLKNNECIIGWFLDEPGIRNTVPYYIPFANRSSILFRSTGEDKGDSIQGKNFGYISYDEGGRSNHLEYELNANIIPRLADLNGSLDIISTPDMKSNSLLYHYDLFEKGKLGEYGYYAQEGSISDNIFLLRNNPTYIEDETRRMAGDPILDQVLHGKFVFAGDALYPAGDIQACKDDSLGDGVPFETGHRYVIGVDTAMGEDEMVYTVLDVTKEPYRLVRQIACKGNSKSPQIHMADFEALVRSYYRPNKNNLRIIIETWNGESANFYNDIPWDLRIITQCYGSWQPQGVKVFGRNMKSVKKPDILLALRKVLATHNIRIPNESTLIKQLSIYREDDSNLKTDRVISLALAAWLATDGAPNSSNEVLELNL